MTDLDPLAAQLIVATLERLEKRLDQLEEAIGGLGAIVHELTEERAGPQVKNG